MQHEPAIDDTRPADETPAMASADEPRPVLLHVPIGVRSLSLAVLAVLACLFVLRWASEVFIPLLLGLMFSYALSPIVDRMVRWRIPRPLAAAVLLLAILAGVGSTAYSLGDDASDLIESLPAAAQKLRQAVRAARNEPTSKMETMQKAVTQLEQAAEEAAASAAGQRGVQRVQIEPRKLSIRDYLWSSTLGLAWLIGQATVVCFITYFLIASGNSFRRKLVKIAGPTFAQRRVTVEALDEITEQIQRYLLVQLLISVLVGIATWIAFLWIGLEHAAVWGIVAAVLNLVPYIGSIAVTVGSALVAFLQFGTLDMALVVGSVSLVLHCISGYLITPWLTSRTSRMSPVVVFVGVLAWGWLWGIWGLLLGVPILMAVKAVCDRVEDLKPLGELLGD